MKYSTSENSSEAQHVLNSGHVVDKNYLKLVRRQLKSYDKLKIIKGNNLLNTDSGPIFES